MMPFVTSLGALIPGVILRFKMDVIDTPGPSVFVGVVVFAVTQMDMRKWRKAGKEHEDNAAACGLATA